MKHIVCGFFSILFYSTMAISSDLPCLDEPAPIMHSYTNTGEIIDTLLTLQNKIDEAPHTVLGESIKTLYAEFTDIYNNNTIPDAWWTDIATFLDVDKFPIQLRPINKPKDQVAAYIFYPPHSLNLFMERGNVPILTTYNSLYRLTFAAKHGHTLALYMVAESLAFRLNVPYFKSYLTAPEEIQNLYLKVIDSLEPSHPDDNSFHLINYIKGHLCEKFKALPGYAHDDKAALAYYQIKETLVTNYAILLLQGPTIGLNAEQYLTLARQGYISLYQKAIARALPDDKENLRGEAEQAGYKPYAYEAKEHKVFNIEKKLDFQIFSNRSVYSKNPLELTLEKRLKIEKELIKAGESGTPEAWGKLCYFYVKILNCNGEDNENSESIRREYSRKIVSSFESGIKMNDEITLLFADGNIKFKNERESVSSYYYMKNLYEDIYNLLFNN